jgi:hypothetical protein
MLSIHKNWAVSTNWVGAVVELHFFSSPQFYQAPPINISPGFVGGNSWIIGLKVLSVASNNCIGKMYVEHL